MTGKKTAFWFRDGSGATNLTPPEAEIMRVVWNAGEPVTVRYVYETMRKQKKIAYTTVMSVMNKLAQKGFLTQDKSGTAYIYSATLSDAEVAGGIMDAVVDKILGGASEPMISRLLGSRKLSARELKELEKLLHKK